MSRRAKYNPERWEWRGISYRASRRRVAKRVRALREAIDARLAYLY